MDYKDALSYALAGEAIFVVGSGFSVGAKDKNGESFLVGRALSNALCDILNMDHETPLDIVSQEYIDDIGELSLVNYLKDRYIVGSYADYYKALSRITNLKVYSTNYDDLLERVCSDNNKRVKGYNLSAKINKADKKNMIMHLNGYIHDITASLGDTFKLTHLSYNDMSLYNSPWYAYLKEEIRNAKAVFIVGMSFKSDLDIRRIIAKDAEITDKCFIIEHPHISSSDKAFLSKYGHVLEIGVDRFCVDLNEAQPYDIKEKITSYPFKSFKKIKARRAYKGATDEEIFQMFFMGEAGNNTYFRDADGNFKFLINRTKLNLAVQHINNGDSIIIHSDLGNGKSIFLSQLMHLMQNSHFYFYEAKSNANQLKEIEILCSDSAPKIIVIDPYNLHMDTLKLFSNFDLSSIRFILSARSPMHDNFSNALYDIVDNMQNASFTNPIDLNILDSDEIAQIDDIILKFGYWGNNTSLSENDRKSILINKCKSRLQNILLYLFNECHIKKRFEESLKSICTSTTITQMVVLSFISDILELYFTSDDYNTIFDRVNIDRMIRKKKSELGDIIDYHANRIQIKSSVISKELIGSSVIDREVIFETLVFVSNRLDLLYEGNQKFRNALKNMVSCSYLSFIFNYDLESSRLIGYYERIKENRFYKLNLFFWEQYAITCINLKEFVRAEKYFQTAYSLAKKKNGFSTFQIDNHYARYLLENQIYVRNFEKALDIFVKAHSLLVKIHILDDDIDDRYYQFRVARIYKEYYEVFFDSFDDAGKKVFLDRCREMAKKLSIYKKGNKDRIRKDVQECDKCLDYILKNNP